jgi:hypothetical protein
MAAHKTPLADAGIRPRKHARFHRTRRAAGTSGGRPLNCQCEPRRMRERSRSRARVAASLTSTLIWALISSCAKYRSTYVRCLGKAGEHYESWLPCPIQPRRGLEAEQSLSTLSAVEFSELIFQAPRKRDGLAHCQL